MEKNRLGMHLRVHTSLSAVARMARALRLPFFQCFFIDETTQLPFFLSKEDERTFLYMRSFFKTFYLHASYLIDLTAQHTVHHILHKELAIAQRVGVTHYIIHPGSIDKNSSRVLLLDRVLQMLNALLKQYSTITFCIENTANPTTLLASNLEDFLYIQDRIEMPERLGFCIDTAHAHAAGYDFQKLLGAIDSLLAHRCILALIHFNDTQEECESYIDRHEIPGRGVIGKELLLSFVNDFRLKDIPLLIEPPSRFSSFNQLKTIINEIITEW